MSPVLPRTRLREPRLASLAAAALGLLVAVVVAGCGGEGAREFRSLGTGGTGGVYYPLGGALASQLSLADSARQYTAEVTGGSVENVNRVLAGQIDLGFALSVTVYDRYHGADPGGPGARLRIVAPLYPNLIHVMVREGSGVNSLASMRGMRISVGSAGSGTEQTSRQLLESVGLTYDDVEEQYLSFSESAAALKDGALDAAILSVGYPAAAVLEGTTTGAVSLLPLADDEIARLASAHPYYDGAVIPSGVYPGVDEPVATVAMMNWLVARDDLPGEIVISVLNILGGEGVSLERVHEMARQIDMDALQRAPIPVHNAAEAWAR